MKLKIDSRNNTTSVFFDDALVMVINTLNPETYYKEVESERGYVIYIDNSSISILPLNIKELMPVNYTYPRIGEVYTTGKLEKIFKTRTLIPGYSIIYKTGGTYYPVFNNKN